MTPELSVNFYVEINMVGAIGHKLTNIHKLR